ncbi:MAG: DUF465 domain-containing protein [Litorimonas sp.]
MSDIPEDDDGLDVNLDQLDQDKLSQDEPSQAELFQMLEDLKTEHRRIDLEIGALIDTGAVDMLKIGRMKKVKLSIKDQITYLENQITPDIIA